MNIHLFNTAIFAGSIIVIVFSCIKLIQLEKPNRTTGYFIWFIVTGCAVVLQMTMIDNGMAKTTPVLFLFYFPFQFLSPILFAHFTFHYLQKRYLINKYIYYLYIPFALFTLYYTAIKVNFMVSEKFISIRTINYISAEIEENFTIIFLFSLGFWFYKIVRNYEIKLANLHL